MNYTRSWTNDQHALCVKLAADGKSALQISGIINFTFSLVEKDSRSRNAVIGYCQRNKIFLRRRSKNPAIKASPSNVVSFPLPASAPKTKRRTTSLKNEDGCQYISGEPRYRQFCAQGIYKKSYCYTHYLACFQVSAHG